MAGLFVLLALILLVSVVWALWPVRNPRVRVVVLVPHLAVSISGFLSFALDRPPIELMLMLLATFGPGFLIALFRLLCNTTEWGERLGTWARGRRPRPNR